MENENIEKLAFTLGQTVKVCGTEEKIDIDKEHFIFTFFFERR